MKKLSGKVASLFLIMLLFLYSSLFAETLVLKSGIKIEGKIIEKTDKYLRIDFEGVPLSLFFDEIESINGEKISVMTEEKNVFERPSATFYWKKGMQYALDSKFNEAEGEFRKGLELNSFEFDFKGDLKIIDDLHKGLITKEVALCLFKGLWYGYNKQWEEAIQEYQKVIAMDPDCPDGYRGLALGYRELGQDGVAIDYCQKALIKIDSNDTIRTSDVYNDLGIIYRLKGQHEEAIHFFEKAIQINPSEALIYLNLGSEYNLLKQYGQAIKTLQKALEINPDCASFAYGKLGLVYCNLGQYQQAIVYFKKALEANPSDDLSCYNLGRTYLELNQRQDAVTYLRKAIEINPNFAEAYLNLGFAYKSIGQQYEAISCYEKAIQIKPNYEFAYLNLGNLYLSLGHYEQAKEYLQKAIEIKTNFAEAYYNLGITQDALGQSKEAKKTFKKAKSILEKNKDYDNSLLRNIDVMLQNRQSDRDPQINYSGVAWKGKKDNITYEGFSLGIQPEITCKDVIQHNTKIKDGALLSFLVGVYSPLYAILGINPFPGAALFLPSLIAWIAIIFSVSLAIICKGLARLLFILLTLYLIVGHMLLH